MVPILLNDSMIRFLPFFIKGAITVTVFKRTPGQHFSDLDMLTKLLTPRNPDDGEQGADEEAAGDDTSQEFDWTLPQSIPSDKAGDQINAHVKFRFGFALMNTELLCNMAADLDGVLDRKNISTMTSTEIRDKAQLANMVPKRSRGLQIVSLYD